MEIKEKFCRFATNMKIKVKKIVPEAVIPRRAYDSDAGFDLVAVSKRWDRDDWCYVYGTGLAFEIPKGYAGLVFPRSSVASRPLSMANCVGVIDSGYRGEVTAKFRVAGSSKGLDAAYEIGERAAQIVFVKLPDVELVEADELSPSERGTGGYGSSGK